MQFIAQNEPETGIRALSGPDGEAYNAPSYRRTGFKG